jgi:hypothetical protein
MEKVVCGSYSMGQGSRFFGWRRKHGRCAMQVRHERPPNEFNLETP